MKFIQIGRTCGDETTPYKVVDYKSVTVRDFIDEVLRDHPNDWGYISFGKHFYQDGAKICEYRYGKLLYQIPSDVLDCKIDEILASGGWSRMDYTINWH